jgi:excisionase family DNA binding protein
VPSEQNTTELNMPSLLTVPEVAEFFRVSPNTVLWWKKTGRLPSIRTPGRGIRFKRSDIESLFKLEMAR